MSNIKKEYQNSSPLKQLQMMLSYTGIDCLCPEPLPEMPFEQLLIPFGSTQLHDLSKESEDSEALFMQVAFVDELLKAVTQASAQSQTAPSAELALDQVILQFSVRFPLKVPEAQLPTLTRLSGLLTQLSLAGAYHLTENDQIFFRHTWLFADKNIATSQTVWLIQMMKQFHTAFYPIMQKAVQGGELEDLSHEALLALAG